MCFHNFWIVYCCNIELRTLYFLLWNFCCILFLRATVCRPLLCLCRPFCIFERCLDSNPEKCRSNVATHPSINPLQRLWSGDFDPENVYPPVGLKYHSGSRLGHVHFFKGDFYNFFKVLCSTLLHIRLCRGMLGSNPGQLRLRHWLSDAQPLG